MGIVGSHKFTVTCLVALSICFIISILPNVALIYDGSGRWETLLYIANVLLLVSWSWYSISTYLECRREKEEKELACEEVKKLQAEIVRLLLLIRKGAVDK